MSTLSTEDDLDVAWSKTLEKCQDIAKWDFKPSSRGLTVDQVIRQINPSTKDPQLKDKAKVVVAKALTCLQRFGSVIAQAASAVFGPSNQVMNGISFLISVTQDYDKVFAGFTTMMERVSAFLQRLQIYLDKQGPTALDKRLRRSVYDVLEDFMTILAHSHRLATSKRSRFKLMANVMFFGDDDGVKDSLARLEVRIADVSRTEISVIVNDLSEAAQTLRTIDQKVDQLDATATRTEAATGRIEAVATKTDATATRTEAAAVRTEATTSRTEATTNRIDATAVRTEAGVGQIIAEQDRRIAKEQSDRNTKRIKEALKPDEKSPWLETHTSLQGQIIKTTGSWLTDDRPSFQRWANPEETAASVLSIDGGEGFGKSNLCSAVVQWLLEKYPKGRSENRVAVAYYYFQRDAKEKASINRAVRDVLWQLTQYDPLYESVVGPNSGGDEDTSRTLSLWKKFIDDSGKKFNGTFFIVLDGVDEPDTDPEKPLAEIVKALLSAEVVVGQLKVRILLSGRSSGLEAIELDADNTIPRISLGTREGSDDPPVNQSDILAYIDHRLSKMDNFRAAGSDNSDLKERIKDELSDGVKGDFLTLGYKLEEIENARNVREIEQILERANETREDAIARGISRLNETLSREEIDEVNEVLNWIIGSMDVSSLGWVDTPALEGLILLKTETAALVPLATQIKTKYNALLDVSKTGFVTLASDDVKEPVLTAGQEGRQSLHPNAQVQEAEIAIMKRVIMTFSGDDLYQRFSFDSFFDSLTGEKARRIHVDEELIHIRVVRACLITLCDKHDDSDLDSLREYSRLWFVDHLRNIDLETASKDALKEIGAKLSKLLMEPAFIDVWWDEEYYRHLKNDWLYFDEDDEDNYMRTITAWMSDPDVSEGWSDQPSVKTWISAAMDEENSDEHILTRVLRRLSERWFGVGASADTFICVHGLYGKIHQREVYEDADPTLAEIEEIFAWAKAELRDIQGEAHWNFRAAVTLKNCSYFDESIARCQKALEEEPSHWRAQLCMAEALAGKGETAAAVDCYQKLDDLSAELLESDDAFRGRYWRDMLAGLADCHIELDNLDVAASTCQKAINHGFETLQEQLAEEDDDGQYEYWKDLNDDEAHFYYISPAIAKLILIWHKQKKFSETVELLQSLDRGDRGFVGTRLAAVVQINAHENDFHSHLRCLTDTAENFKFVDDAYKAAIELSATRPLQWSLSLRTSQGMLAWLCGSSREVQDGAFDVWNAVVATENEDGDADIAQERSRAARQLPRALLERVKAFSPGSEEAARYMSMLQTAVTTTVVATSSDNKAAVLSLARAHHLAKNETEAKAVLAERMTGIFKNWNEESDSWWYHLLLAHTFTALDDNENALAAWSLLAPKLSAEEENENGDEAADQVGGEGTEDGEQAAEAAEDGEEGEAGGKEANGDEEGQAVAGAEAPSDDVTAECDEAVSENETTDDKVNGSIPETNGETDGSEGSQENADGTDATGESSDKGGETETNESELQGWLHSFCDGCHKGWTYVDNIYCCRDCLDVQLEPDCYAKLKAGELDPTICGKDHDFLHIPSFVEEEWRARATDDLVKVGETTMPRKEWLKGIRSEWGVEQEKFDQIKLTASSVRAIERFWKVVKARRRTQAPKRSNTGLRGMSVSK